MTVCLTLNFICCTLWYCLEVHCASLEREWNNWLLFRTRRRVVMTTSRPCVLWCKFVSTTLRSTCLKVRGVHGWMAAHSYHYRQMELSSEFSPAEISSCSFVNALGRFMVKKNKKSLVRQMIKIDINESTTLAISRHNSWYRFGKR